jgi:hypothetical protein
MFMPEPDEETLMSASAKLESRPNDPDQLTGTIQGALAALADIEFRYDLARERLGACDGSDGYRKSLNDPEAARDKERAPLIEKVAELQRKMLDQLG